MRYFHIIWQVYDGIWLGRDHFLEVCFLSILHFALFGLIMGKFARKLVFLPSCRCFLYQVSSLTSNLFILIYFSPQFFILLHNVKTQFHLDFSLKNVFHKSHFPWKFISSQLTHLTLSCITMSSVCDTLLVPSWAI